MKNRNEIAAFLEEIQIEKVLPPENDEFTAEQLAKEAGISSGAMRNRLKQLFNDGRVTRRKIDHTLYYKIKK